MLLLILLAVLIIGDPGSIDRDRPWLHNLTSVLIGLISVANADTAVRLVVGIIDVSGFTQNAKVLLASGAAIWLSNIIAFALWFWNLDRGGPAARAAGTDTTPALIFPEMLHPQHVEADWSPTFVDYFHFSFATATAFSPTDVSTIKPWAKLMLMRVGHLPRGRDPRRGACGQHLEMKGATRPGWRRRSEDHDGRH